MKILNFGSINIDFVYHVPHIVRPSETLASTSRSTFAGGKGNNQSVALAKAGVPVFHAGNIGADGQWIINNLKAQGANVKFVKIHPGPTGHAVIQVSDSGQNSIVLFPGANHEISRRDIHETISHFGKGDILLLQNEINAIPDIMKAAHKAGLKIWFNPAPFHSAVTAYPLSLVDVFILNEIEAAGLSGEKSASAALSTLSKQFPKAEILITLGSKGAILQCGKQRFRVAAPKVKAIDTTAAGDTFIGYYAASLIRGLSPLQCLTCACKAAAISVTRKGAADSIPNQREVFGLKLPVVHGTCRRQH